VTIEDRLRQQGIALPPPFNPTVARLLTARVHRGELRVSGQTPRDESGLRYIGKLGRDFTLEEGQAAARLCALNVLAQANRALEGDLDRIAAVLNVRGYVNAVPEFHQISETVNGASDLFLEVFGEARGLHTRTAVGAATMPFNVALEIEATFALD
jgi:enamine deaminase RidA (YjgF/YER057c/UK114 family)